MAKYVLLDTKTSGLPFKNEGGIKVETNDRVLQFGYIVLKGKEIEIVEDLSSLPAGVEINFHAMSTHNIIPEMIEGKPLMNETDG